MICSPMLLILTEYLTICIFATICMTGLHLNPSKYFILHQKKELLGHIVCGEGLSVDAGKITVVKDWPISHSVAEFCSFLGLSLYYRWFVWDSQSYSTYLLKGSTLYSGPVTEPLPLTAFTIPQPVTLLHPWHRPQEQAARHSAVSGRASGWLTSARHSASQNRIIMWYAVSSWQLYKPFAISAHTFVDSGSSCAPTMHPLPVSNSYNLKGQLPHWLEALRGYNSKIQVPSSGGNCPHKVARQH